MRKSSITIINNLFERIPTLKICEKQIYDSIDILYNCFYSGNKLLICGNGGSAADSQHIVGELMKPFNNKRLLSIDSKMNLNSLGYSYLEENLKEALPTISLTNEFALNTAIGNDMGNHIVFAQQIFGLGKNNDVLLAISTSGNSKNIIYAIQTAIALKMPVIGLTGSEKSELEKYCTVCIKAPSNITYIVQEYHVPIYHHICLAIENEFYGE